MVEETQSENKTLSEPEAKKILGVSSSNIHTGNFRSDEFLPELKGRKAIHKFREMRDNDATIGAVMYATEQVLRDVKFKVVPTEKGNQESEKWANFVEGILDDMEHTLDDHISEALGSLTYGFGWFEVVYKRRVGPEQRLAKKRSKYSDNLIGIRKIASRAPWTINKFDVDTYSGEVKGIFQNTFNRPNGSNYIPKNKSLYYRTTVINGDPSGRSILRNAYTSYERLKNIQDYEAIGIERELAGIPVGRLPADYLSPDASDEQKKLKEDFERVLRDLKFNEQGYALLPSDTYPGKEGEPTNIPLMDIKLMASEGTRNINLDPVIRRYQHDIARSILAEFIMLGSNAGGSYALSKSKTDLFLRGLESYINMIADVLNKQLLVGLWNINGLDYQYMPKIVAGDVAPYDLASIGSYLRNLNGAGIPIRDQTGIVDELFGIADLPKPDPEVYSQSLDEAKEADRARNSYYVSDKEKEGSSVAGPNKDQNKDDEETKEDD